MASTKPPAEDTSDQYKVGYGKPPRHTRFRPGESGNPKGRPKGTKNLKTDLIEELSEKVVVKEGDQARKVSKQRAFVKTLVARTLKGDARAATTLLSMMMRLLDTGENAPEPDEGLHADELEILESYKERLRRSVRAGTAPTTRSSDSEEEDLIMDR